jgi:predicted short-subunit dehydrogenase-like oxidoreductase (DUF2520 family)
VRELDRELSAADIHAARSGPTSVGVVGAGRLGTALAVALREAGFEVDGPVGRGEVPRGEAILLCVPDSEIRDAATVVAGSAPFVGHTSGATPLAALEPAGAERFGLHPLQTFAGVEASFEGCGCAVAGSTPRALAVADAIASRLGMWPFELTDDRRAAYHAAASIASNFLVTLQAAAESMAVAAGLPREEGRRLLAPLVRSTVENWAALGPESALTGPVARGDELTVAAQRAAVADAVPELLELFDELVEQTRALAGRPNGAAA